MCLSTYCSVGADSPPSIKSSTLCVVTQVAALQTQYPSLVSCAYMAFLSDAVVDIPSDAGSQEVGAVAAVGPASSQDAGADAASDSHIPKCVFCTAAPDGCCSRVVSKDQAWASHAGVDRGSSLQSMLDNLSEVTCMSCADCVAFAAGSRSCTS